MMKLIYLILIISIYISTVSTTNCKPSRFFSKNPSQARKISPRIASGTKASRGQFPWQVLLKKYEKKDDVYCGGSIISPDYVLTAAHCTEGLKSIYLLFGIINIKETPKIAMTSDEFFKHPEYNPVNQENDISLIKLPKSLVFSDNIKPIPLMTRAQAEDLFVGKNALILGWGFTNDEHLDFSEDLRFAQVKVIINQECEKQYGKDCIKDSTICGIASTENNESICTGDSGGPLMFQESPGKIIQIGISSFIADRICTEGFPTGFVRLGLFLDHIQNKTGIDLP